MIRFKQISALSTLLVFCLFSILSVSLYKTYNFAQESSNKAIADVNSSSENNLKITDPNSMQLTIKRDENEPDGSNPFNRSDPGLKEELKKVVIYKKWLGYPQIVYVDSFENPLVRGQYYDSNPAKIEMLNGIEGIELRRYIAHEYLHHVYANLTDLQKVTLGDIATYVYASNNDIARRMEEYTKSKTINPNEIFAISCTEYNSDEISSLMLAECDKYILRSQLELN